MAKPSPVAGRPSNPDPFVLRSGARSGHKREFAFCLSQVDLLSPRTRSWKSDAIEPQPQNRKSSAEVPIAVVDMHSTPPPSVPLIVVDGVGDAGTVSEGIVKEVRREIVLALGVPTRSSVKRKAVGTTGLAAKPPAPPVDSHVKPSNCKGQKKSETIEPQPQERKSSAEVPIVVDMHSSPPPSVPLIVIDGVGDAGTIREGIVKEVRREIVLALGVPTRSSVKRKAVGTRGLAVKPPVLGGEEENTMESTIEDSALDTLVPSAVLYAESIMAETAVVDGKKGGFSGGEQENRSEVQGVEVNCGGDGLRVDRGLSEKERRFTRSMLKAACVDMKNPVEEAASNCPIEQVVGLVDGARGPGVGDSMEVDCHWLPNEECGVASHAATDLENNVVSGNMHSVDNGLAERPRVAVDANGDVAKKPAEVSGVGSSLWEKPARRFTRSVLKVSEPEQQTSMIEAPNLVEHEKRNGERCNEEKLSRTSTRSAIKLPSKDPGVTGTSETSIGSEEKNIGVSIADGSLRMAPTKKMELKMSKKIALTKLPSNVRDLLGTGLLEGFPVRYRINDKKIGLEGMIKGNEILCYCASCKGSKSFSAYNFEVHAGSTKKHPSDFIFLENGKSLRDVLKACTSAPLDMLETVIQIAIGTLPTNLPSTCVKCRESFHSPYPGKFALLCESCLKMEQPQPTPGPSNGTSSHASKYVSEQSQATPGPSNGSSSRALKNVPQATPCPSIGTSSDASNASKNLLSQKKSSLGRLTKKDLSLHKLVFMDDILPEGTEVGYYNRGKRLLDGYINGSGIFCGCCEKVISPSQFEAHAGQASRRKPYNSIYTSNGVSLHELSVSLSKGRKMSACENDDLCGICSDGGDLLCCDLCPRSFHKECVGLSGVPEGEWHCQYCQNMHQRDKCVGYNDNAIAAGRVSGVDPIDQIIKRCIRIVTKPVIDIGGCALCRQHDFSKASFDERTVMICDQCEKEYHVGCLKDRNMADLKELPQGEWFCCADCSRIYLTLQELLFRGSEPLLDLDVEILKKKVEEKGLNKVPGADVRWRLLSGKTTSSKSLLREAVSIFQESFDPILEVRSGRDLIPVMVNGESAMDQDFGGMYCAILTVNSSIVSAGILRILGSEVAELPLVATRREIQGKGYFQSLFSCIERLLGSLNVKHFVLPAADEALSIWKHKFGFTEISSDKLQQCTKGVHPMIFHGTSMLYKPVPRVEVSSQGNR